MNLRPTRRGRAILLLMTTILAVGIVAFFVVAPSPPFPPKGYGKDLPPARLLDGFPSYSTPDDVRRWLESLGLRWEIVRRGNPPTRDDHLYIVKVQNFSHLGATGDLWLYFFRDRLMRIHFGAADPATYWGRLRQVENLHVVTARDRDRIITAKMGNDVEVWLNMYDDGRYVGWRDDRLEREVSYLYD
ncbi:MAG: hypothetical protein DMD78_00420 [Candidatus Rokuibacteriota bacterium]|nr:MAG: hypothetical protein DMD78_00420 [Candidatus Rokubacteria bacterium]